MGIEGNLYFRVYSCSAISCHLVSAIETDNTQKPRCGVECELFAPEPRLCKSNASQAFNSPLLGSSFCSLYATQGHAY